METRDAKNVGTHGAGPRDAAKDSLAVRRVVWISFVLALVAYGFVGVFAFASDARPVQLPAWLWPVVAGVLGMGSLFVSGILRGRRTSPTMTPSGSVSARTPAGSLPMPEVLAWGMAEGVGIIGLVSVVLGGSVRGLVIYLVAALVVLVLERPGE
jgi:hypothetical protein